MKTYVIVTAVMFLLGGAFNLKDDEKPYIWLTSFALAAWGLWLVIG